MKVCLAQIEAVWEDIEENLGRAEKLIKTAKAELICLPELFSTQVTLDTGKFAQMEDGVVCSFLKEMSLEYDTAILGSYIRKNPVGLPFNSTIVYKSGEVICRYDKNNVFIYGGEDKGYSRGEGLSSFTLDDIKFFPFTCFDLRFPKLFEKAAYDGADAFIVTANWPVERINHWSNLLTSRAVDYQCIVLGVNIVGKSPKNKFVGGSKICNRWGETISKD